MTNVKEQINLGAYLQIYKNNGRPEFVLEQFRKHYPDSPIYLVSDNGDNFLEISKKYNCRYEHSTINTGVRSGGFVLEEMREWLRRMKRCFEYCDTEFVIYLEDDVYVRNKISINKSQKIAGLYKNQISTSMINYFKNLYNNSQFNIDKYGACGGTIYHRDTLLLNFDKMIEIINSHFHHVKHNVCKEFAYLDCTMCVLYMCLGYQYFLNENLTETYLIPNWETSFHPIVHLAHDEKQKEIMESLK